jgi:5-formyltetrahydrofolate cyclo-ligase
MDGPDEPRIIDQEKTFLRKTLRERRKRFVGSLPASVRALSFRVLPSPVLAAFPEGAAVSLYHATGHEAPTLGIAAQLSARGHALALPRVDASGLMDFAAWHPDDLLVTGPFRTLQPAADAPAIAPDVIVAPLVGFDGALNRLGQGGGYYDRAFAAYPHALRIGLAWSAQQVDVLPVETLDRPLDIVVTEAAYFERQDPAR